MEMTTSFFWCDFAIPLELWLENLIKSDQMIGLPAHYKCDIASADRYIHCLFDSSALCLYKICLSWWLIYILLMRKILLFH